MRWGSLRHYKPPSSSLPTLHFLFLHCSLSMPREGIKTRWQFDDFPLDQVKLKDSGKFVLINCKDPSIRINLKCSSQSECG